MENTRNSVNCDIFLMARDQFLDSLFVGERRMFSNCASAEQMIKDIRNLEIVPEDKKMLNRCADRVKSFSDKLEPYFEIINIFIQSNPQFAAIAWGAMRLVLKVIHFHHYAR